MNEKDAVTLTWLRAVEWSKWPLFLSQPLIPVLLGAFSLISIAVALLITSWLWCAMRQNFVSYPLSVFGVFWVRLKWLTIPSMAIYFCFHHAWMPATLSLLTPIIILPLQLLVPPAPIGLLQNKLLAQLGYSPAARSAQIV